MFTLMPLALVGIMDSVPGGAVDDGDLVVPLRHRGHRPQHRALRARGRAAARAAAAAALLGEHHPRPAGGEPHHRARCGPGQGARRTPESAPAAAADRGGGSDRRGGARRGRGRGGCPGYVSWFCCRRRGPRRRRRSAEVCHPLATDGVFMDKRLHSPRHSGSGAHSLQAFLARFLARSFPATLFACACRCSLSRSRALISSIRALARSSSSWLALSSMCRTISSAYS